MPSEVYMSGAGHDRGPTIEGLKRELAAAREQQAATAEILRVISSSPTDVQPVFDTIARSGVNLCSALGCVVFVVDGDMIRVAATHGVRPERVERFRHDYPVALSAEIDTAQTIRRRRMFHLAGIENNPNATTSDIEHARLGGYRTRLMVPMVRGDRTLGLIAVTREDPTPFPDEFVELLKIFADQAVIAIENTRLFEAEQASKRELQESLEYQTATSEVLSVISRSPSDLQPVLDTISATAGKLCEADDAHVLMLQEGKFHLVAHNQSDPKVVAWFHANPFGMEDPGSVSARAARQRRSVHVHDVSADPDFGVGGPITFSNGRSVLSVPLLRVGTVVGVVTVSRRTVRPFTDRQIALVQTFADQAVIAIENTRLFEEVQARTRELTESLEQQTATSEVLGVISSSPTDVQPVLDAIVKTAVNLCNSHDAVILLKDANELHIVAHHGPMAVDFERIPIARDTVAGRSIVDRVPVHVHDLADETQSREFPLGQRIAVRLNQRTVLGLPLLREGQATGCLFLRRTELLPFMEKQIALLQTFADQAVIAIENTRLFEEVQARNRELRVALEQQTATSELLKVIGRSTFDLQPVFEMLIESAVKLCGATRGFVSRFDGKVLRFAAGYNVTPELRHYFEQNPFSIDRNSNTGRAALERRTVHNIDVRADPEYTYGGSKIDPYRTVLAIPMLRADDLLGVILIYRHEVQPFTSNQIALIETFADQAVIAIENTRLFEEVQARNRDLTALSEVGRAVTSTLDLKVVLKTIVDRAVELSGTDGGSVFYFRDDHFELGESIGLDKDIIARFRKLDIAAGETGLGEAIASGKPLQIADITKRPSNALRNAAIEAGLRAALIVPLLSSEGPLGALVLQRRHVGEFPPQVVSLMQSFADQSTIALENARLFNEIAQKSRELEIASQHKSQFVANMSHELRTPLAAILGYAELIQEGFYEPQGPKSLDALTRIRSNGKHLLGLINTVLDIAKIESGQFTLNMTEYAIESVVETVRAATESLAQNKKLTLTTSVDKLLPVGLGDEQRLTQVLLNLVGNAIKFTDTGEVRVTAKTADGRFNVSVTDTGPGIPVEHQTRIFDQFHQVDSSNTKAKGGTGLGLAIAKQIVEMHGGRIWVESILGKGSTFQMELPTRAATR